MLLSFSNIDAKLEELSRPRISLSTSISSVHLGIRHSLFALFLDLRASRLAGLFPCSYFPTLPQAFSLQLRPHGDFTLKTPMFSVQTMPEKFSENGGLTQKTHHMFSLIYMLHYTRKKEFVNATITWFCV